MTTPDLRELAGAATDAGRAGASLKTRLLFAADILARKPCEVYQLEQDCRQAAAILDERDALRAALSWIKTATQLRDSRDIININDCATAALSTTTQTDEEAR